MTGFCEIYDGRFIGVDYRTPREEDLKFVYADVRDAGTTLVLWLPFHARRPVFNLPLKQFVDSFAAKWEQPGAWSDRVNTKFLDYRHEDHSADDDPLRVLAEASAKTATFTISINLTLAVRKALRRYLALEPAAMSNAEIKHGARVTATGKRAVG